MPRARHRTLDEDEDDEDADEREHGRQPASAGHSAGTWQGRRTWAATREAEDVRQGRATPAEEWFAGRLKYAEPALRELHKSDKRYVGFRLYSANHNEIDKRKLPLSTVLAALTLMTLDGEFGRAPFANGRRDAARHWACTGVISDERGAESAHVAR